MKELSKEIVLMVLLVFTVSFLVSAVSASDSTVAKTSFVYTSYSADGSYAVKSSSDNNIYFFDTGKNAVPWTNNIGIYIGAIAISPNGNYVAVGCGSGLIFLFDREGNLLWKKPFGDAAIRSIAFSKDSNYIDASNELNQAFYIGRTGNQADRPTTSVIGAVPSATLPPVQMTSPAPTDYLPLNNDANSIFGNSYFVWIVIALLILFVYWGISSSRKKTGTAKTYQPPPPNGAIYIDSIPKGAEIYFDGIYAGVSPVTIPNVIPAIHMIEATLSGYHPETQRITISAGQVSGCSLSLRKVTPTPKQQSPPTRVKPPQPPVPPPKSFQHHIAQLGAKAQEDREEAQKHLIIKLNTECKSSIQQIVKELENQPSVVKREIVNLLYYYSKESNDGQKVTDELIVALTYSSPEVKWLIIQTLGRLKDKRALSALQAAASDSDFLVKYWAIISLKSIQES
jgi:hypothetical protein